MNFEDLTVFNLKQGGHDDPESGLCAMEAVAWLEGLEHTDAPACTCPVIAAFVRNMNDRLPDNERQKLVAYLPRLVDTVAPEFEQTRAEYLAWYAITVVTPNVFDQIGLHEHAQKLRSLEKGNWAAAAHAAHAAADAAAAHAAHAAYAAAHAAYAAAAAYAAYAAHAAYAAAYADYSALFTMLDGVLEIGPKSPGFSTNTEERTTAYREKVLAG